MTLRLPALALLISVIASPALAVSQHDIDALFAHPPSPADGDINQLLQPKTTAFAPVQVATPESLASLKPSAAPVAPALTTTNLAPTSQARIAQANAALKNMFEVSYAEAEQAVSNALAERGIADKVSALMDGRKSGAIFAYNQPTHVETRGLQIDKDHSRWSASIAFSTMEGEVITALPASGHYSEVTEVPVLKRAMRNGEVIAATDIELRDFALSRTRMDTITDLSSLIGKTPVHGVSPFRPIRDTEIANLPIMKRDAIVQIDYSVPGMQISTAGQALTAGAQGDVIDVRNTTSKKVVRAVIVAADHVQVIVPTMQTSQLTSPAPTTLLPQ